MDIVIYDGDCTLCSRIRRIIEALDWLGTMHWIPLQSSEASRYGIPREKLEASVYLVSRPRQTAGAHAVQGVLLRLPLTYFVMAYAIRKQPWSALAFAFLFSPAARPVLQPGYEWVARNRYRIPGSSCDNQIK